jgi:hypothetical protein
MMTLSAGYRTFDPGCEDAKMRGCEDIASSRLRLFASKLGTHS